MLVGVAHLGQMRRAPPVKGLVVRRRRTPEIHCAAAGRRSRRAAARTAAAVLENAAAARTVHLQVIGYLYQRRTGIAN